MENATVELIANYAEILGAFTIVTALAFGLYQIRMHRAEQANLIATQLTQTFMDESLALSVAKLRGLPDNISAAELRALGPEFEEAAIRVTMSFETMGLLVYREFAERQLALDLAGGIIGVMWRKTYNWQMTLRAEQQQPSWAEWFEWLALQSYGEKGTAMGEQISHQLRDQHLAIVHASSQAQQHVVDHRDATQRVDNTYLIG